MLTPIRALFLLLLVACKTIPPGVASPPVVEIPADAFIFMGDTGTGDRNQYSVGEGVERFCRIQVCDIGILLGDNIYPKGVKSISDEQWESKFEKPYRDLVFKFYAALGNHDHYGKWQAQVEYKSPRWAMPDRYYKLQFANAAVFVIDTHVIDENQAAWLDQVLGEDDSKLKIVAGHHPIYSEGSHGDDADTKRIVLPLLKKHGVRLYMNGHDHDQQVILRDDIYYVTAGAGGKLRDAGSGRYTLFSVSKLGFSHLDLKSRHLRMIDKAGRVLYERVL